MEDKIKKINKNYYRIKSQPFVSVFLDEFLMKKANKILFKYKNEIDTLLQNNPEHLIKEEWSLVYPNGEQKSFYGTDLKAVENASEPNFRTQKVDNLFFIGDVSVHDEEIIKKVEKII